MKITKHADGTVTLEGTAEELAQYAKQAAPPRVQFVPMPCLLPHYEPRLPDTNPWRWPTPPITVEPIWRVPLPGEDRFTCQVTTTSSAS